MRKMISIQLAGMILLVIFGLLVIFHILVLSYLLPPGIVWGGQAGGSSSSLLTLEIISLFFTLTFAIIVAARIGYIQAFRFLKVIKILLWIIFAYLLLNSIGNFVSGSSLEKLIFTPISIVAALLALRLAIEK